MIKRAWEMVELWKRVEKEVLDLSVMQVAFLCCYPPDAGLTAKEVAERMESGIERTYSHLVMLQASDYIKWSKEKQKYFLTAKGRDTLEKLFPFSFV